MSEGQQIDIEELTTSERQVHSVPTPVVEADLAVEEDHPKKSSGYARLKRLHHALRDELEALKSDYEALQIDQEKLQKIADQLLEKLEQVQRRPANGNGAHRPQQPWFETANQILNQVTVNPDPRAIQTFQMALASLQQRAATIVLRNGTRI